MRPFDQTLTRAEELARSGLHIDCITIEIALEREGYFDAHKALRRIGVRAQLRKLCDVYWREGLTIDEGQSIRVALKHHRL